jgi:hypothetical protein
MHDYSKMASKGDVERFLADFKTKLGFWGLLILTGRRKNFDTIKELEFSIEDVKNELKNLELRDYAEGPVKEALFQGADMWVFGKVIQSREIYIKITLGQPSSKVLCISFHFAEKPLVYPYKGK